MVLGSRSMIPSPGYPVVQKTSSPWLIVVSESAILSLLGSARSRSRVGSARLLHGSARGSAGSAQDSSPGSSFRSARLLFRRPWFDRLGAGCWARPARAGLTLGLGSKLPKLAVAGRFRAPDHPTTRTASPFPSLGLVSLK